MGKLKVDLLCGTTYQLLYKIVESQANDGDPTLGWTVQRTKEAPSQVFVETEEKKSCSTKLNVLHLLPVEMKGYESR